MNHHGHVPKTFGNFRKTSEMIRMAVRERYAFNFLEIDPKNFGIVHRAVLGKAKVEQ